MKIKKILISSALIGITFLALANAQVASTTIATSSISIPKNVQKIITKSDKEITKRINSLNKTITKIGSYKHLSSDETSKIVSALNTSITNLNTLKTKIDSETDLVSAKADYSAIFKDNRIYSVVIPQETAVAKIDKIVSELNDASTTLANLKTKLVTLTTASTTLSDASTKLADASLQATNYLNLISTLKIDNGDKTIIASNENIFAQAKGIRITLQSDISAFKKDIKALKKLAK
ncbi:MAG: hypothetical protein WCO35_00315 [Candidatus Nomurabacteria bacterium]